MGRIMDIADLGDGAAPRAEIVVVGSGVAGAEVATSLARAGHAVLVVESGREAFDAEIQALNALEFRGKRHRALDPEAPYHRYLPPDLRGVSRVRMLGGTSMVWTGKWKHFQEWDFPGRDWVPDSDWPIRLDDLLEHYRSAAADYGLGDVEAEARNPALAPMRETLARHDLKMTHFFWEETPLRTGPWLLEAARQDPRLSLLTGATVTGLELAEDGRRIRAVRCAGRGGRTLRVEGRVVVLATGGIETPRILLASDDVQPGGIGNAHDLVGRFYADHPKHHEADMDPGPLTAANASALQYGPKPRYCICFALSDELQRAHKLLEHVIYLKPLYETRGETLRRMLTLGGGAPRDELGRVRAYRIKLVTEQEPNRESRVLLSDERDALGMRKAVLDWRLTDADRASFAKIVELSTERFARAGLGRMRFDRAPAELDRMTDAAHQMGTMRMAATAERGVVDPDCRVFGTENLYVAGSAVFPTGPSYSPTFTILALARRLAVHLDAAVLPSMQPALAG
jgi:choline dehydrogenase-like flavoprotein